MRHLRHANLPRKVGHGKKTAVADARVIIKTAANEPTRAGARVAVATLHFASRSHVAAVARAAAVALDEGRTGVAAGVLHGNQEEERQEKENEAAETKKGKNQILQRCFQHRAAAFRTTTPIYVAHDVQAHARPTFEAKHAIVQPLAAEHPQPVHAAKLQ